MRRSQGFVLQPVAQRSVVAAARTDAVCAPTMLGGGGKAKAKKVAKKPKKVVKSMPRWSSKFGGPADQPALLQPSLLLTRVHPRANRGRQEGREEGRQEYAAAALNRSRRADSGQPACLLTRAPLAPEQSR